MLGPLAQHQDRWQQEACQHQHGHALLERIEVYQEWHQGRAAIGDTPIACDHAGKTQVVDCQQHQEKRERAERDPDQFPTVPGEAKRITEIPGIRTPATLGFIVAKSSRAAP